MGVQPNGDRAMRETSTCFVVAKVCGEAGREDGSAAIGLGFLCTVSLAQGVVHWGPPDEALAAARDALGTRRTSLYGPDAGCPELRAALGASLAREYGLTDVDVMVTAGANQAFLNVVLLTLDDGDAAALFAPFYFNHRMALQMCGHHRPGSALLVGPATGAQMLPDLDWLEAQLRARNEPGGAARARGGGGGGGALRLVTLCTPCNPTGVSLPQALVDRASALCATYGAFLFLDHAYAAFAHDGARLATARGPHVFCGFSFSKAYGMAGWRVGVLAHPPHLGAELLKVQDTAVICPTLISQAAALGALRAGTA